MRQLGQGLPDYSASHGLSGFGQFLNTPTSGTHSALMQEIYTPAALASKPVSSTAAPYYLAAPGAESQGSASGLATPAGSSFTDVTGGIAAILAPLAQVGVSIYQSQQMAKLEKARLKAEAASQAAMAMMQPQVIMPPASSNTGLLVGAILGGATLLGLLVFMMTKNSAGSAGSPGAPSLGVGVGSSTYSAPPRIKRIKRVSRPRQSY